MEKASRKIISMPVYSVNEGHYLGHVKNLVIDPAEKRLIALLIEQRLWGREEKIVPFTKVQGIGEDVITIDKTVSLERKTNIPQILQNIHHPVTVTGIKVLTDTGKSLGRIDEYYIDTDNGEITTLEISSSIFKNRLALKGRNIITMAAAAIIVANQAIAEMNEVQTPVAESLNTAKEAATAIVSGTTKVSKKISQGIANSINKYKGQNPEPRQSAEDPELLMQPENISPTSSSAFEAGAAEKITEIKPEAPENDVEIGVEQINPSAAPLEECSDSAAPEDVVPEKQD